MLHSKDTREGGNYSDVLHLRPPDTNISNLTSSGISNLNCRQTQRRFIWSRCVAPR